MTADESQPESGDGVARGHEGGGKRLGEHRLVRLLGEGAMGAVFLAYDGALERYVALKAMRYGGGDEASARRLLREARAVAKLDHPGIAPVFGAGRDGDTFFIISGFIAGPALSDELAKAFPEGGSARSAPAAARRPEWVRRCVNWAIAIAEALDHAHRQGIVHRDIKPSNILLDENDAPKVVDFGIASLPTEPLETRISTAGTIMYLSPERAQGEGDVPHPRDDVYSLGVVLYESLTGRRPYEARSLAELLRRFERDLPIPIRRLNPAVPRAVERVTAQAMAIDPRLRYASAEAFAADLRRALAGEPTETDWLARPRWWLRRWRRLLIAAASVGVAASAAFLLGAYDPPAHGVLTVEAPAGTEAVVVAIDGDTRLAAAPVAQRTAPFKLDLKPGDYRVVFRTPEGEAEATRTVRAGDAVQASLPLERRVPDLSEMIFVPGGPKLVDPRGEGGIGSEREQPLRLEPFWIDRHEVSNAEYRAFVEATGAPAPRIWPEPYDPAFDDLPVVGVTKSEAQAYAEWAGKRLPTDSEWELAALGDGARRFPWGDEPPEPWPKPVSPTFWGAVPETAEGRAMYLEGVRPVDAAVQDVTSEGGHWFYGNVAEWTESTTLFTDPQTKETRRIAIVKGSTWNRAAASSGSLFDAVYVRPERGAIYLGFRCAVSASAAAPAPSP